MNKIWAFHVLVFITIALAPFASFANSGDFTGGVAIGSGYAGVDTAPTNGLIVQGVVGIGTASPSDMLDVNGAIGLTTTTGTLPPNGLYSPAANSLALTTSGVTALTISTTGYVGIGTTSPNQLLDVNGGSSAQGGLELDGQSTSSSSQYCEHCFCAVFVKCVVNFQAHQWLGGGCQ